MASRRQPEENDVSRIFRTRLHLMTLAGGAFGMVATLFMASMIVRHNDLSPAGTTRVLVYGTLIACLWLVGPVLRYLGFEIVVQGDELLVTTLPFAASRSARIGDIESVVESSGGLGRQLGYGTVVIYGRAGTGATLRHVRNPAALCRALGERAKAAARRRP
jgi:uncharacterized membrane protein YsdA (DUF1294 family)